jgi:hypothetical protein
MKRYGPSRRRGGPIAQRVKIIDPDGDAWEARYTPERQLDGTGCSLLKAGHTA